MQQVFTNGSNHDDREILIKSDNNHFSFYFYRQYLNQINWIDEEKEKRMEEGADNLIEEESTAHEFYWIDKEEWRRNLNNWHTHMRSKNWYTDKMYEWMNKNSTT